MSDGTPSPAQPAREPWWDRKLTLLITGFVLTGLIGPWLQFVQKQLEWQREIRLVEFNRKLAAMQGTREELTKAYVAASIIIEQVRHDRSNRHSKALLSMKPQERYSNTARDERLRETAALFVMADSFKDPAAIKEPMEKLVAAWKVLTDTEEDAQMAPDGPQESQRSAGDFDTAKDQFYRNYNLARRAIQKQIGEYEDAERNRSI